MLDLETHCWLLRSFVMSSLKAWLNKSSIGTKSQYFNPTQIPITLYFSPTVYFKYPNTMPAKYKVKNNGIGYHYMLMQIQKLWS